MQCGPVQEHRCLETGEKSHQRKVGISYTFRYLRPSKRYDRFFPEAVACRAASRQALVRRFSFGLGRACTHGTTLDSGPCLVCIYLGVQATCNWIKALLTSHL